jgi:signal transduction histidine kinase
MGSSLILFGFFYFGTVKSELNRVDQNITAELKELEALYAEKGPVAVEREVFLRSASGEGLYFFQHLNKFTGNLAQLPIAEDSMRVRFGFLRGNERDLYRRVEAIYSIANEEDSGLRDRRMRGILGPLRIGSSPDISGQLLVGRDVEVAMRNAARVKNTILISAAISLALGLLSGFLVSRKFSSRVEEFNRLATDIRKGHLDRRASRNHSGDELDLLAEHLNEMLDHIDRLMKAMRYAGDSIAHDLRSPLTRLRTRLESAAVDMGEDDPSAEVLFSAADDAGELLQTFDSVLRIARLEAGERRELLKELDPKPLLDDIAELYEPACEDAGLNFSAHIEKDHLLAADRGLLSQAVSNLVENAIKYTPKGGEVSLSLEHDKSGRSHIIILDNGPGIPAAQRQRVKERFVRLDQSRTEKGSGLGLALVDAIADLHRAEFVLGEGISNESQKNGLSARLIFPRVRRRRQKDDAAVDDSPNLSTPKAVE